MNTRRQIVNQEDAGSVIKNITRPFCQNGNAIMDDKFENKTKTMEQCLMLVQLFTRQ